VVSPGQILHQLNLSLDVPSSEKVPELFSGKPTSPLWFVVINPGGTGKRPTYTDLNRDPYSYLNFYLNRFEGVDLTNRRTQDAYGNKLSETVANHLEYTNEFCIGAGIDEPQRWTYVMKTNKFGTHAESVDELFRCRCVYPLDDQIDWLISAYRPAIVVSVGKWPRKMLSHAYRRLHDIGTDPDLPPDSDATLYVDIPRAGWLRPNGQKRQFFRKLGLQWAARLQC
jgi:hypothetical protein